MAASSRRSRSGQASGDGRSRRDSGHDSGRDSQRAASRSGRDTSRTTGRGQIAGPSHGHGHGHSHGHGPAAPASTRLRAIITALLLPVAAAAVAGLALLWPHNPDTSKLPKQIWVHGTVTASKLLTGAADGSAPGSQSGQSGQPNQATPPSPGAPTSQGNQLTIQITDGPTKGASVTLTVGADAASPKYTVGDDLVLTYNPAAPPNSPPEAVYDVKDFQRGPPLMSLAIAFALFVVVVGRWRGVGAIAALALSFGVLVKFTLPAILAGENSIEVAAVTAGVILFAAMYATHGISVRTSVAVLGTAFSLALIGALGEVSTKLAHLTGLGDDNAGVVAGYFGKVDIQGLLLAGIIIGALGVLNDVTATQVSSVWELKAADPSLGVAALFRAGMRIGRDHIGSTVNTLVLAYAGGALPLFVLMTTSSQGWAGAAGAEVVAEEIVRTLVGSIGLAAAVPITTALAAYFAAGEGDPEAEASALSYTDLRERRSRRSTADDFGGLEDHDDLSYGAPATDDTLAGARLGRNTAPRTTPVPRMPESRRSGEWNLDGTRAGTGTSSTGAVTNPGAGTGAGTGAGAGTGTGTGPYRDPRHTAARPMPYPAPASPPQQPVDPYGQGSYGSSDPFENPQYYQ